jgi:hypothetical protein
MRDGRPGHEITEDESELHLNDSLFPADARSSRSNEPPNGRENPTIIMPRCDRRRAPDQDRISAPFSRCRSDPRVKLESKRLRTLASSPPRTRLGETVDSSSSACLGDAGLGGDETLRLVWLGAAVGEVTWLMRGWNRNTSGGHEFGHGIGGRANEFAVGRGPDDSIVVLSGIR